jgi:DNA polymerase-3 subunit epsilon
MVIRPEELAGLKSWMERNSQLRRTAFICDAYKLLEDVLADGVVTHEEHAKILNIARPFVLNEHNKPETIAMQELIGFLRGISCDKKVNIREAKALQMWMDELHVSEDNNFKAVRSTVSRVLEDGVIDETEEAELLKLFGRIVNPGMAAKKNIVSQDELTGIIFAGNRFVLTGNFSCGDKKVAEDFIKEHGGEIAKSVSSKVAYVVQGNEGCEAYAYGTYGGKIKKAMELQDAGKPIKIIQEDQLGM